MDKCVDSSAEGAEIAENGEGFNTVFDDVFRTIAQKMPFLLIPLINEFSEPHMRKIRNFYNCVTSIMKSLERSLQIPLYKLRGICTISNASQKKTGIWYSG